MLEWLIVTSQGIFTLGALMYWTGRDNLQSIAKEIQKSRNPHLLNGHNDEPDSKKKRRAKAKDWIEVDTKYAEFFGYRAVFFGICIIAFIYICTLIHLEVMSVYIGESWDALHPIRTGQELAIALIDAASFDLFFLFGRAGEYAAVTTTERASVYIYLISEILIISAIIAYVFQSIISRVLLTLFPVHVYWASTDSRDGSGRRGVAEKIIRFLMDFNK